MEIQIAEQTLIYIVAILLFLWLIVYFAYRFGSWKLRIKLMRELAKKLNLEFIKKDKHKIHYLLSGNYLGKTISIEEFNTQMNPFYTDTSTKIVETYNTFGFQPTKKMIITVDDKLIYEKNGDRLLPFPNKIKKILDNYINKGVIIKNSKFSIVQLFVLAIALLMMVMIFIEFIKLI